ncbi:sigma-70 family RNA polymerase sigma factor [Phenylobacterium sp.]|uniref:sigma-70 family RNA polymerase sigma factor n=1 Tax=Phenylobacterium sp. TaxID=1871053 RepID=UPI002DECDA23|nr:sigma-70 family RNA polymerase sigma factor [Phenylobacterium sp.]
MARQGNSALIEVYLERRQDLVRFFTVRLRSAAAAEDLVQEIYLRLSSREGPDAEIQSPTAYLYRLGSNLMLDRMRGERRAAARDRAWRETHRTDVGSDEVDETPNALAALEARQRLERIVQAVTELGPQTQRVFRLHKLEGLSHTETAAQLGISRSAVEKHMIAVLKHLARRLP